jgi:hypothetical protein
MPIEKNLYIILTDALNQALNVKRQKLGLTKLEEALIARKLGILFAFKTNKHVNFKAEQVEFNANELVTLHDIIAHYFNVDMDIRDLAFKQKNIPKNMDTYSHDKTTSSSTDNKGLFNKIKGLFKRKET